jgi:hypothetical protein
MLKLAALLFPAVVFWLLSVVLLTAILLASAGMANHTMIAGNSKLDLFSFKILENCAIIMW